MSPLHILVILSMLVKSYQEEIQLVTHMQKWRTYVNLQQDKECEQSFRYENRKWTSDSCEKGGTNVCVLATEKYKTTNVRELTLKMSVVTYIPKKDLYISYIGTDKLNNQHRQIHSNAITASDNQALTKFEQKINVTNYDAIVLEFSNFYGYCGMIRDLNLSYHTCKQLQQALVKPPSAGTPNINDKQIRINASCKVNSAPSQPYLYYICSPNGSVVLHGDCICLPGYRVHNSRCMGCPKFTYKPEAGNMQCNTCGAHSYTTLERNKCRCRHGYYRELTQIHNSSAPCYNSRPLKLIISSIRSDSAYIEWKVVNKSLNWKNIHYTIHCDNCLDNEGNFPFQTYKHFIQLNDLEPSKKYVISVTASSGEGVAQIASTTIWGKFITAHASYGKDIITIIIISIIVPLVVITTTIFVYMYCKQKRKSDHLRKKITSLKRQRRPPKPPTFPLEDKFYNYNSDTLSDINPYAVYVPPLGMKLSTAKVENEYDIDDVDKNGDVETKDVLDQSKTDDYESMDGVMPPAFHDDDDDYDDNDHNSENPYIKPSWLSNSSNNHSYVDIKDASYVQKCVESPQTQRNCYMNIEEEGNEPSQNKYENIHEEKQKPLLPMRHRVTNRNTRRERTTSCLYNDKDPLGFELDCNELNQAKLNNKYTRFESNQNLNIDALIKRSHSADDINKLSVIL